MYRDFFWQWQYRDKGQYYSFVRSVVSVYVPAVQFSVTFDFFLVTGMLECTVFCDTFRHVRQLTTVLLIVLMLM